MKRQPPYEDPHTQLQRFCAMVAETPQTPHLISRVAADAAFVHLCRQVVGPARADFAAVFRAVCRQHRFNATAIRRRLLPVVRALRLDARNGDAVDYYALLGVSPSADDAAIKRAFRRRALRLHPDRPGGSSRAFIALQAAYVHLSDPELRRRHDRRLRPAAWVEARTGSAAAAMPRTDSPVGRRDQARRDAVRQFGMRVGSVVVVLVAVALIVDLYFRENAFFSNSPPPTPGRSPEWTLHEPSLDAFPRLAIFYAHPQDRELANDLAALFDRHFQVTTRERTDDGASAALVYFYPEDRSAAGEVLQQASNFLTQRQLSGPIPLRLEWQAGTGTAQSPPRGSLVLKLSAPGADSAPGSSLTAEKGV